MAEPFDDPVDNAFVRLNLAFLAGRDVRSVEPDWNDEDGSGQLAIEPVKPRAE